MQLQPMIPCGHDASPAVQHMGKCAESSADLDDERGPRPLGWLDGQGPCKGPHRQEALHGPELLEARQILHLGADSIPRLLH